jgi:hypothetical protein
MTFSPSIKKSRKTYAPPKKLTLVLSKLCKHYKLPVPKIRWTRAVRAHTNLKDNIIYMGPKSWVGSEYTLLHEFSHVYAYLCYKEASHGLYFWVALHKITSHYYGSTKRYPWSFEYKAGQNFAKSLGII